MPEQKALVKFLLDDNSEVIFETDAPYHSGPVRIAQKGEPNIDQAEERFNKVAQRIRPAAQLILDSLRDLNTPKEIGLEFGLKFSAKAGVIFASADSEVNFKVTVKWINPNSTPPATSAPAAPGSPADPT